MGRSQGQGKCFQLAYGTEMSLLPKWLQVATEQLQFWAIINFCSANTSRGEGAVCCSRLALSPLVTVAYGGSFSSLTVSVAASESTDTCTRRRPATWASPRSIWRRQKTGPDIIQNREKPGRGEIGGSSASGRFATGPKIYRCDPSALRLCLRIKSGSAMRSISNQQGKSTNCRRISREGRFLWGT